MKIVNGKEIAGRIIEELKQKPAPKKRLVAVLVGNDPASESFLRQKEKTAVSLGVFFELFQFSETDTQDEVEERIKGLCHDEGVGGVILQLPLPKRFGRDVLIHAIDPKKDVDNLTGKSDVGAPAVGVVQEILKFVSEFPEGLKFKSLNSLKIAIVGKGFLVGQPIARWLERESDKFKSLKFKTADIETENLEDFVKDVDLVITGVGKEGLIKPEWLKEGAGIIDFGFPPDFDILNIRTSDVQKLTFYTPTPGGTGPILVAKLFENFYRLCG